MGDPSITRPSLLLRIRDARDIEAWSSFADIYSPLVRRFALRNGLQEADADDLAQEVMAAVAKAIGTWQYDPAAGRFRSWLFTIARNKLNDGLARGRRQPTGSGDTTFHQRLSETPAPAEVEDWDREYEERLFHWAAQVVKGRVQSQTWEAFWRTTVEGREAADVAAALGVSVGSVYVAKNRVVAKLREAIQELGDL